MVFHWRPSVEVENLPKPAIKMVVVVVDVDDVDVDDETSAQEGYSV